MEVPVKSENGEVACSSGTTSRRPRVIVYQYQLSRRAPLPFKARAPLLFCIKCIDDPQVIAAHSGNPTIVWPPNCINCNAPINRPKPLPQNLVQGPSESPPHPEPERPPSAPPLATSKLPCPECGKLFANSNTLSRHKQLHSTEQKYPCKLCSLMFQTSKQAYRHSKKCPQRNLSRKETQSNIPKTVETEVTATTFPAAEAEVNLKSPIVNLAIPDGSVQPVQFSMEQDVHVGKDVPPDLSKSSTSTSTYKLTPDLEYDDDVLDNIEIIEIKSLQHEQMQIDTEGESCEDNSEAEVVPVTPVAFSNTEKMETDTESGTETESTECDENSSEDEAEPEPVPPVAPSNIPVIVIPLERSMPVTPALEQPKPEWVQESDDEMSESEANAESMTDVAPSRMVQMETDVEAADEDESGGKEAEADAEAEPEPVAQVAPSEPPVPATIVSPLEQLKPEWVRGVKNVTEMYRKCIFCGRNFPTNSKQNMEQHFNTTHTFENWYFCAHCPAALKTYTTLKTHVKKMHPKESRKAPVQNVNPEVSMPSKRAKTMATRKSEPKPKPAAKRVTRTSTSTATSTSKKEKEKPTRQSQRLTKRKPKPEPNRKPKSKVVPPKPKVSKAKPRVSKVSKPKVSKPKVSKPKALDPVSKKRPHVQPSTSVLGPSLFPGVPFSPAVAVADMMMTNGADDGSGNQDNRAAFLRWSGGVSIPVCNVLNEDDFQFMLAQGILMSDEIPASNSVDLAM